jgi:hypothetical protein
MAWQPLTLGGVAAFGHAPWCRLWLVQSIIATASAVCFLCFFLLHGLPVIDHAISQLPAQGRFEDGQLQWNGDSPVRLAEGSFLAIVVDLEHTGHFGQASDLLIELGRTNWFLRSLLGRVRVAYPPALSANIGQDNLQPWWNAWMPFFCLGLAAGWALILLLTWPVLALIYSPIVVLLASLMHRSCPWSSAQKLAGAALMPGALFLSFSLVLYAFRQLELVGFLVTFGLHLVLGWIYILLAPTLLPANLKSKKPNHNPFHPSTGGKPEDSKPSKNPFE